MKKMILVVLLFGVLLLTACTSHIADTNGEEDYSLCALKPEELTATSPKYLKSFSAQKQTNGTYSIKVGKMSGVEKLFSFSVSADEPKTFVVTTHRTAGNLYLYVYQNGQILQEIPIGESQQITISGESGTCEIRVAAGSAAFSVEITAAS